MYDLLAALSFLPLKPAPWASGDQRGGLAKRKGLSSTAMHLLDALAALAVSEPDDVYTTALTLPPQTLALYVSAQAPVPATATKHLQNIWSFLQSAPSESDVLLTGHRYGFVASQMRYSWKALRGRLQVDGAIVIATLTTALAQLPNHGMPTTPSPQGQDQSRRDQLGETMREPLTRLLQSVQNLRTGVLSSGVLEDSVLLRAFSEIGQLHKLVFGPDATERLLSDLEFLAGAPLSKLLARIVWLAEPCARLWSLMSSSKLGAIVSHPFNVIVIPPLTRQVVVSLDKHRLFSAAAGTTTTPELCPGLADLLETYVFHRVEIVLTGYQGDPTSTDSGALNVPLHPELALLAHLDSLLYDPYPYIGMSEPACLLCHEYIATYSEVSWRRESHVRGSDCHLPFPWVAPSLHGNHDARIMRDFVDLVSAMFASACFEIYTHLGTSG
ncbi:hypothetical protein EXIGLDRAFT_726215 [Exidia glandulosa HHB12029]|uniref:Uncharacterized protein n=1 Tax=Exidia glandulosa HHB12029 TaxID=1314781 RepID=A0A165ME42_EXIGL|nr:hypothetical protein EXIGLDRAFT_726215 [Exidia glandulosa HHB12029]